MILVLLCAIKSSEAVIFLQRNATHKHTQGRNGYTGASMEEKRDSGKGVSWCVQRRRRGERKASPLIRLHYMLVVVCSLNSLDEEVFLCLVSNSIFAASCDGVTVVIILGECSLVMQKRSAELMDVS